MVSYLTKLFLGKPPRGSLPVLSVHSLASNRQLVVLESAGGKFFQRNNVPEARVDLGTTAYEADTLLTEIPSPVVTCVIDYFLLDFIKSPFYYTSTGLMRSVSHGDVSVMISEFFSAL